MNKLLPLAGIALALTLGSASAYAAPGNPHGPGPQGQHQQGQQYNNNGNQHHAKPQKQIAKPPVVQKKNDHWNNNGWNNKGPKYAKPDFKRYRGNFKAPKRFRVGVYHGPRGFVYHRYGYGQRLPLAYLARNFWLSNVVFYGLFNPPPGLIWVRYGDDALLVDRYTGEVVQVRYGLFY